jgi:succinate dehydrogenase/fumarate reductase flavoprotein subunit
MSLPVATDTYNLIVVGSGFAGCMATLNFLETCKKLNKNGRVCLVEVGKEHERCGASRWTMAYLRLDKDLAFDPDWKHEMKAVSKGEADMDYCEKLQAEAQKTALYVQDHGVKFNHHDEQNVLLEFNTDQHFGK